MEIYNTKSFQDSYNSSEKYKSKLNELISSWSVTYQQMASDFAFASGGAGMWDKQNLSIRQTQNKPIISLPLIQPYVDRIVAPIRVHPPGMAVRTEDPGLETLVNGLIRGIEKASSSTDRYAQALKCAATGGLGWLYLSVEDDIDGPVIRIKSTSDPTVIMLDPLCSCLDGRDAQYACYRGYMSKDQARRQWGEEAATSPIDAGISQMTVSVPTNSVLDCIWYMLEKDGMRITRTVGKKEVYNQLFEGVHYLPVVPVIGEELFGSDGRRYGGLVRRAKDVNQSINFTASNVMELVAMAPKSPWITPWEGVENFRDVWATANTEPHAYIPYKHKDKDGDLIPTPQRLDNSPQTAALQTVADWMMGMMGRVTGISDAMLGGLETANESGKSLIARMEAAEGASSQYIDHLTTSITQLARVLVEMLPIVYAGERSLVLIDDAGRSTRVKGNVMSILTSEAVTMLDVEVESGPSMELKRKNAAEALSQIITTAGDKGFALIDLWAETQNLPNAQKVQDRIKKLMPPELMQDGSEGEGAPDPQAMELLQQAQETVQQKDQTIQYLESALTQLQTQVASNEQLAQLELRKAEIQAQVSLQKTQMEIDSKREIEMMKQGSEDVRLATKLSSEQQKQVADIIAKMMLENQKTVNSVKGDVASTAIEGMEQHAKVPGYVLDDVSKALNEGNTQVIQP